MKIDPKTGLHVPDDYEPPEPKLGGWPPRLDIADDAKTTTMGIHTDAWSGKMWGDCGDPMEPGRMPK